MTLTAKQRAVLDFIREFRETDGISPSLREIQKHFGFASSNAANKHLAALEKKGALRRTDGLARHLVPANEPRTLRNIPLLGMIPAGMPADQVEQPDRSLPIDPETFRLTRQARAFALEVRGDSMIDAGILDRDIAILELAEPRDRDIVAALIDGETTLKRYLLHDGRPYLRAENPRYPDLLPARELIVQGVFRGLVRIAGKN